MDHVLRYVDEVARARLHHVSSIGPEFKEQFARRHIDVGVVVTVVMPS